MVVKAILFCVCLFLYSSKLSRSPKASHPKTGWSGVRSQRFEPHTYKNRSKCGRPLHLQDTPAEASQNPSEKLSFLFRVAGPVRFGYRLGWNGSSGSGFRLRRLHCKSVAFLCFTTLSQERTVPVSVPGKRFRQFRCFFRFQEKRLRRFRFPVSGSVPEPS